MILILQYVIPRISDIFHIDFNGFYYFEKKKSWFLNIPFMLLIEDNTVVSRIVYY